MLLAVRWRQRVGYNVTFNELSVKKKGDLIFNFNFFIGSKLIDIGSLILEGLNVKKLSIIFL